MSSSGSARAQDVFAQVKGLSAEERRRTIDRICGDDELLRNAVQGLLHQFFADESGSGSPLGTPEPGSPGNDGDDPCAMIGRTISHYFVEECIGGGGMGVVYRARDLNIPRNVAIKFLPSNLSRDDTAVARFKHEATAATSLDHANIATVLEIDRTADGALYIVMVYYDGETLRTRVERGALPAVEAVAIAGDIASGLAEAHRHGIVHRDVKPANVMVTADGHVKVLDFGIAKVADLSSVTGEGHTVGTVAYMSPEQTRGEEVDHRTDIWSFGAVLYEMLTGSRPFRGDYYPVMIYQIQNEDADLSALEQVSPELKQLVGRCLQKDREDRHASFPDVLTDLATAPEARGVRRTGYVPPPVSADTRTVWRRVWPWATALAAVIGLVLWMTGREAGVRLAPSDYVVISDFDNETSDAFLDHSLTEALSIALRQSPYVNVLPKYRVLGALRRMDLPVDRPVDHALAREIALREGARIVIGGGVRSVDDGYVLTAQVFDASSDEPVAVRHVEAGGHDDILPAMDRLARAVRSDLGESLRSILTKSAPLAQVTTPSLEALEYYSQSVLLVEQGQYGPASHVLEQSVARDSSFAMALSNLAYSYRKTGRDELAVEYHNRVLPLLDNVTDRERFMMLSVHYGPSFELDYGKAYESLREWSVVYPNDALGHAQLGHLAMFVGDYDTAILENRRAEELDSSLAGYLHGNSGFALALAGRADEALAAFRRAKRERPAYLALDGYIAQAYWIRGDLDSAETVFSSILPRADSLRKAKTHFHLAALYHFQGRLSDAEGQLKAVRRIGRPEDEAYLHLLSGEVAAARGDTRRLAESMGEAVRTSASPFLEMALAAGRLAEEGYASDAERALELLIGARSPDPLFVRQRESMERFVMGELALHRGDADRAQQYLGDMDPLRTGDPLYLLVRSRLAAAFARTAASDAVPILLELLEKRGEVCMAYLTSLRDSGFWVGRLWPGTHLELAKVYLSVGDSAAAVGQLARALDSWRHAEEDFLPAREARRLYQSLTASADGPSLIVQQNEVQL